MRGVAALEAPDFPAQAAKGDTVQMESPFLLPPGRRSKRWALPIRMSPTFSFFTCKKENVPDTVQKKKRQG